MHDATLPTASDAARQMIGGCLIDPSLIAKAVRMVRPAAIVEQQDRATWLVMADMHRRGEPIDILTVCQRLKGRVEFAGENPTAYLAEIGRECVTAANVPFHASLVAEADLKRRIHREASAIAEAALNGKPAADILADLGAVVEDFRRDQTGGERFKPITARELANGDYRVNWVIDWFLVEGQPCILAGGKKCLKTTLLCDLLISLAIGGAFLEKFIVRAAKRVMFFSAESGEGTLQETCQRIAASKGWDLADVPNFILFTDLPRLDSQSDMAAFEVVLDTHEPDVVALDPCYLMMPGGDAGNLFIQGEMLLSLSRICKQRGITLILCHHTRRHRSGEFGLYDPPELEDIAWAGFQEFARQWILVGRREAYVDNSGVHNLWMNFGGSAGHGGLWAIDADEGVISDHDGRHWSVTLSKAHEAREQTEQRRDDAKARRAAERLQKDVRKLVETLSGFPSQQGTKTDLKSYSSLPDPQLNPAIAESLRLGYIQPAEITKANRQTYDGFRINPDSTHPDAPG